MNKNTTSTDESGASDVPGDETVSDSGDDQQSANGDSSVADNKSEDTGEGNPTDGLPEKMSAEENLDPPDLEPGQADDSSAEANKNPQQVAADENAPSENAEDESESDEQPEQDLTPEQQVLQLQEQLSTQQAGFKDDLLRMQAEMQNQRKRLEAQSDRARKFAVEGFAKDLLEVKDSLEMGLEAAQQEGADVANFVEGADLTLKMLSQSFGKHNIAEINPMDEKFNPELHEAMSQAPVEGKEPNTVIGVIQKGYTLNGRVIRAARVMVAK